MNVSQSSSTLSLSDSSDDWNNECFNVPRPRSDSIPSNCSDNSNVWSDAEDAPFKYLPYTECDPNRPRTKLSDSNFKHVAEWLEGAIVASREKKEKKREEYERQKKEQEANGAEEKPFEEHPKQRASCPRPLPDVPQPNKNTGFLQNILHLFSSRFIFFKRQGQLDM